MSQGIWVYLMRESEEASQLLQSFVIMGKMFYSKKELSIELFVLTVLNKMDGSKRRYKHVLNIAQALRFQVLLPIEFWEERVLSAAYLINTTPSRVLHGKTSYEKLFGKAPSVDRLKVFGCLYYAQVIA